MMIAKNRATAICTVVTEAVKYRVFRSAIQKYRSWNMVRKLSSPTNSLK